MSRIQILVDNSPVQSTMNLSSSSHFGSQATETGCSNSSPWPTIQLYLSTSWYLFLAGTTAVGLLVSLISNMIIIYLFTCTPALRQNPSNIIAINLSLSDLLYCSQWPSVIYSSLTQSTWILEIYSVCQVFGFITVSTGLASVVTVLVMSIERVFVIRNPLKAYSSRLAWLINLLIWLVCILSSVPPLFGRFNRYTLDPSKTSCTLDYLSSETNYKLYIVVLFITYWILPFLAISFSYALIFFTFKKSSLTLETVGEASFGSHSSAHSRAYFLPNIHHNRHSQLSRSSFMGKSQGRACLASAGRRATVNEIGISVGSVGGELAISGSEQVSPNQNNSFFADPSDLKLQLGTIIPIEKAYEALRCLMMGQASCFTHPPNSSTNTQLSSRPSASQQTQPIDLIEMQSGHRLAPDPSPPGSWKMITKLGPGKIRARLSATTMHNSYSHLSRARLQFRLARMSLYLILLWLISWTPLALLSLLNSLLHCHRASSTSIFVANTMTKLGPTFDVFIYGISHPKIKSRFRQIIGRLFRVITFRCSQTASK